MFKYIKLRRASLLSSSIIIFSAGLLANIFHYLFHLTCGKLLQPLQYAELETVVSLNVLFGLLLPTLSLIIVNSTAKIKVANYYQLFRQHINKFKPYVLTFWLSSLALYLPMSSLLHLQHPTAYIVFSLQIITASIITICLSVFQSQLKFGTYSAILLIQPIFKLSLTYIFLKLGWGITGAVTGFVAADLITILLSFFIILHLSRHHLTNPVIIYPPPSFYFSCFMANIGLVLIPVTNTFVVRTFLSLPDSAHYSAASILGKVMLFVTSTIITISYPIFVKNQKSPKATRTLLFSLIFLVAAGLLVTVFYQYLAPSIVNYIYGSFYRPTANLLTGYSVYLAAFSAINLITNYYLSQGSPLATWSSFIPLILQLITTGIFHPSVQTVIFTSTTTLLIAITPFVIYPFIAHDHQIKKPL